ncbi:MAG: hypothetical protein ACRD8O_16035 [Bryobacteraceae bacterium]
MRHALWLLSVIAILTPAQTVQMPSPRQGRPEEVLPLTRFRPRTAPYQPTVEEKRQIQAKLDQLDAVIRDLRSRRAGDALLADVEIFAEAARWILQFPEEFNRKEAAGATLDVLDQGLARAVELTAGRSPWTTQKGRLIRGYRSEADGSVQPFRLTVPDDYDGSKPMPLDVIEHGRYVTRYEVEFISAFARRGADRPYLPGTIQVELFGRGNNAFHWPYWAVLDGLEKHYQRAEIDAKRSDHRAQYDITTKNLTRLILRETDRAALVNIDGQKPSVKAAPEIALERSGGSWRVASGDSQTGLRKRHALQVPIDDAFLEPFLIVKPTGAPWNAAANRQARQIPDRFDRQYKLAYRGRPRMIDDKDVTESDFQKYHVVLFGDPGSNRWITRMNGKLPVGWTREQVTLGNRAFPAAESLPAFIYPNPLNPSRYVVINSGLTALWEDWAGDFPTPQYGDFAILRVNRNKEVPDVAYAGLFDESWRLP